MNEIFAFSLAGCVASVSVRLGSKESQRNGIFGVLPAQKMVRDAKRGGGEGRSFLSPIPSLVFWLSPHFSRGKNTESSSVFLCSQTPRKRLLRRLIYIKTVIPSQNTAFGCTPALIDWHFEFTRVVRLLQKINGFLYSI